MMDSAVLKPSITRGQSILSFIMVIIVGVISNYIYTLAVYVGPLNEAHGWSMNMIVMAYSLTMMCEFPAFIVGGWFMKKFGTKKVLVVCGVLYGLAILISGLTSSVYVFIASQGILGALSMYGVFIATLALINVLWPNRKGLVMGVLYGSQAAGGVLFAPLAAFFIAKFNVSTALVLQGVIFTVIMFICCMLIADPTKGNKEMMAKAQEAAEAAEAEQALAAKAENARPTMGWKKALSHPAFWLVFISIVAIQMIGNLLVSDLAVIADSTYHVDEMSCAWVLSAFNIGAGIGAVVIGFVSDRIGPSTTTFWLGIIDGVVLIILALVGSNSFMVFAIVCIIQGFTYNGMTALNPIMMTDAYAAKDIGTTMGFMGLAYIVVGFIGPQLGLSVPFAPVMIICAVLSVFGGVLVKFAKKSLNKYYTSIESKCVVR